MGYASEAPHHIFKVLKCIYRYSYSFIVLYRTALCNVIAALHVCTAGRVVYRVFG